MSGRPRLVRTPVSDLVLGDRRVLKFKRAVRLDFVDLTDVSTRQRLCEAEVALNRRLSPDVYEGVGSLCLPGSEPEPMVVMRALPPERSLAALVAAGDPHLASELERVAGRLAQFHRSQPRSTEVDADCTVSALQRLWRNLVSSLEPFAGSVLDADLLASVVRRCGQFLLGRNRLVEGRLAAGRPVDGHGDLSADDVFCLEDGPRLLDCLEFDDRLRHVDGLADAAFLALDLERLGRPDLAWLFLRLYSTAADDRDWPTTLVHHWMAYRALVRAKVACLRWSELDPDTDHDRRTRDASEAEQLLALAAEHARAATVRLVLVGGAPGTGKSTLAHRLGGVTGWPVLSTDVVRRESSPPAGRPPSYADADRSEVYARLLDQAGNLAAAGRSVVLDATWERTEWRRAAAGVAAGDEVVAVQCWAPLSEIVRRAATRQQAAAGSSDAGPEVAEHVAGAFQPWPEALRVDTSGGTETALSLTLAAVGGARDAERTAD